MKRNTDVRLQNKTKSAINIGENIRSDYWTGKIKFMKMSCDYVYIVFTFKSRRSLVILTHSITVVKDGPLFLFLMTN